MLIRAAILQPERIDHAYFTPEVHQGDHVIVVKFAYGIRIPFKRQAIKTFIHAPARGDLVMYRIPDAPDQYGHMRIIGLPGEHLRFNRKTGEVYIEGRSLSLPAQKKPLGEVATGIKVSEEKFGEKLVLITKNEKALAKLGAWLPDDGKLIPAGEYFGLLDQRDECCDSREFGAIPLGEIMGKVVAIYMNDEKGIRFDRNRFLN